MPAKESWELAPESVQTKIARLTNPRATAADAKVMEDCLRQQIPPEDWPANRRMFAEAARNLRFECPEEYTDPVEPDHPTKGKPGSPEKMAAMTCRIYAGFSPFHPDDARLTDDDEIRCDPAKKRKGGKQRWRTYGDRKAVRV